MANKWTSLAWKIAVASVLAAALALVCPAFDAMGGIPGNKTYAAVKLNAKSKTISVGKTFTLKVKGTKIKKITWKTSNSKVVSVSKKGKVKAKKTGKATITAKVGKKSVKCKITVVPTINKKAMTLYAGDSAILKVSGASAKWSSSNPKVAIVSSKGKVTAKSKGTATITAKTSNKKLTCKITVKTYDSHGSDSGNGTQDNWDDGNSDRNDTSQQEIDKLISTVSSYSYKVTPISSTTNSLVFVETDNPDPMSFQLEDKSSIYATGASILFKPMCRTFADVSYSNSSTRRISGKGYIFYCEDNTSDGGKLSLMANQGYWYQATDWGATYSDGVNYDTSKVVNVASMRTLTDYLIDTYAPNTSEDLFTRLDKIQAAVDELALYPKSLLDTSRPASNGGFPCLATSPYPELSLNKHIENVFFRDGDGLFLDYAYGLVLDSLGVPGTMSKVAKRMEPSCSVSDGYSHAFVEVTHNGETQMYGGAGNGGSEPLYSRFIDWKFSFDGSDKGYGTDLSLDTLKETRERITASSKALAEEYMNQISTDALDRVMGAGAWLRCAIEGSSSSTLCFVYPGPDGEAAVASDAWVDGRYVNQYERYEQGVVFAEHPTSTIVLSDVTYAMKNGQSITGTVAYDYREDTGDWRAPYYYSGGYWTSGNEVETLDELSPNLVLSPEEVSELVREGTIAGTTSIVPSTGYIFDGTAAPGTRF